MSAVIRRVLALLLVLSILAPAAALAEDTNTTHHEASNAPVVVDVLVMRPVGFVSLVLGVGLFAVTAPLTLITRPMEMDKPFKALVVRPAKFLWSDPLGGH